MEQWGGVAMDKIHGRVSSTGSWSGELVLSVTHKHGHTAAMMEGTNGPRAFGCAYYAETNLGCMQYGTLR